MIMRIMHISLMIRGEFNNPRHGNFLLKGYPPRTRLSQKVSGKKLTGKGGFFLNGKGVTPPPLMESFRDWVFWNFPIFRWHLFGWFSLEGMFRFSKCNPFAADHWLLWTFWDHREVSAENIFCFWITLLMKMWRNQLPLFWWYSLERMFHSTTIIFQSFTDLFEKSETTFISSTLPKNDGMVHWPLWSSARC